jgi:hypothetical protein
MVSVCFKQLPAKLDAFSPGELSDAWLNRDLNHEDRVQMALRAHFFTLCWRRQMLNTVKAVDRELCIDPEDSDRHYLHDQTVNTVLTLSRELVQLVRAHRDFYPTVPLCPDLHGSEMCGHAFGLARQLDPKMSFASFLTMQRTLALRYKLLTSGKIDVQLERNSKTRYLHTLSAIDLPLNAEMKDRLTTFPSDERISYRAELAWKECVALWKLVDVNASETLDDEEIDQFLNRVLENPEFQDIDEDAEPERYHGVGDHQEPPTEEEIEPMMLMAAKESWIAETIGRDHDWLKERDQANNIGEVTGALRISALQNPLPEGYHQPRVILQQDGAPAIDVAKLVAARCANSRGTNVRTEGRTEGVAAG